TRSKRDWSSDVCSSDLNTKKEMLKYIKYPIIKKKRAKPFNFKKSLRKKNQNLVKILKSLSSKITHFRTIANIATVAGKRPKKTSPIIENSIHSKLRYATLKTHVAM